MAGTPERFFIVYPLLHSSGFGNQMGMLLQHLAIAARSGRTLALPPFHQPSSHREARAAPELLEADSVLNLTALSPIARVLPSRQLAAPLHLHSAGMHATFSSLGATSPTPLFLPAAGSTPLAALQLLASTALSHRLVGYCHLLVCRQRMRRACRRVARRASCALRRHTLPNNYLFAHRLLEMLCVGRPPPSPLNAPLPPAVLYTPPPPSAPLTPTLPSNMNEPLLRATAALLDHVQREALGRLVLAEGLRARARALARVLGRYAAVHVRLPDVADAATKGINASELPALLRALAPRLRAHARHDGARGGRLVLYVASNRPNAIAGVRGALQAAVGATVTVQDWRGVTDAKHGTGWVVHGGLRDALVEHELCVQAPIAFYGSAFSTWANLIVARRWSALRPSYAMPGGHSQLPDCAQVHRGNRGP
ncbi:hypothetical protein AB1Y20_023179 [Prymnesium parvum]|uniref:GDP-fucose protein O-fucosyltransferase 1 n=1 Tax=Prymnesium parvum TaxID=97485 RepID=A0AB34JFY5_PRYPA